jgi:sulfotransferase
MDDRIHFIAGLPRSGSTLLSAILRQNPKLHAGISSPVAGLFQKLLVAMGATSDYYDMIDDVQRRNILRALFDGYYHDQPTKIVFDTNRYWPTRLNALVQLFPTAKVICCVRDPLWVLDSFERLIRRNAFSVSKIFETKDASTVYNRVEALSSGAGAVGFAWNAIHEAYYSEDAEKLIFLDYQALTQDPKGSIEALYRHLGFSKFVHDFEHVQYRDGGEFDDRLGVPGLHTVTGPVEYRERKTVLPPEIAARFMDRCFWRKQTNQWVTVIMPPKQEPKVKAVR